ncbi:NAD-dependent deacylase [Flavobacterium sp. NST-5]|uniref:NAD-dependent protein deacylase n=1 Tax=Flavobacterium ichthyis TaxID=2698827 RepID=A0ABW9ZB44_9FLAO|nr:NAD-dependent deacylase [Flavobacterium ichthyis]NBL64018.1 NAD-dependent deacylase [Flavobacterium ichthyis]
MKNLVVLSGAGISAESGIKTFRDADGLWEGHNVMEVASPQGWKKNPELVLDFYNQRRRQLKTVIPNEAHKILAQLQQFFNVKIITQNVDDLHERAGSQNVLHLHGELLKARSIANENKILDWQDDIKINDKDENGHQIRPHIVWFGEMVPALQEAAVTMTSADIVIIIGTSMQVYPAAGLIDYAPTNIPVYYIDLNPAKIYGSQHHIEIIAKTASAGMKDLKEILIQKK